ncbi:MAG: calcium-binding protein, partial [Synechococcaceae cyanobacterium]|nr:calcium-binding protein [Synechococcaceae cyanobacterium]
MAANLSAADSILERLQVAQSGWWQRLQNWAASGDFSKAAQSALNLEGEPAPLSRWSDRLSRGEMADLPPVQLVEGALLPGVRGAYGRETATIYLNASWLATADEASILAVLSEELGHHLDAQLNGKDSPGDEGARFAAALLRQPVSAAAQQALLEEDDQGLLALDGDLIAVEFSEIIGTPGDDTLEGTEDPDVLRGLEGNDTLLGRGGADQLFGDADNDTLDGGDGNDVLKGGDGNDYLYGRSGDDILEGEAGDDNLYS